MSNNSHSRSSCCYAKQPIELRTKLDGKRRAAAAPPPRYERKHQRNVITYSRRSRSPTSFPPHSPRQPSLLSTPTRSTSSSKRSPTKNRYNGDRKNKPETTTNTEDVEFIGEVKQRRIELYLAEETMKLQGEIKVL